MSQIPLLFNDLYKTHKVQEPTYKDVIIIYRTVNSANIKLKRFLNVPRADVELIYPAKEIKLNTTDSLFLYGTVLAGLIAVFSQKGGVTDYTIGSGDSDSMFSSVFLAAISGTLMLIGRAYILHQQSKSYYDALLTKTLYHRQVNSDESLLMQLVHDSEQQEIKEAILGYFQLLLETSSIKEAEIDEAVELYLFENHHKYIDFEVHDSLKKLTSLGLVSKNAYGKYENIGLDAANKLMYKLWTDMDFINSSITDPKSKDKKHDHKK